MKTNLEIGVCELGGSNVRAEDSEEPRALQRKQGSSFARLVFGK
jgi:hypothetical protein